MSDHKPECPMLDQQWPKHPLEKCEYCDMIAACEQRVLAEREANGPWFRSVVHDCCVDKQTAYAAGLDAAREAVAALPPSSLPERWGVRTAMNFRGDVLAAIDALREKQ